MSNDGNIARLCIFPLFSFFFCFWELRIEHFEFLHIFGQINA